MNYVNPKPYFTSLVFKKQNKTSKQKTQNPSSAHTCWHHQAFLALLAQTSWGVYRVLKLEGSAVVLKGLNGRLCHFGPNQSEVCPATPEPQSLALERSTGQRQSARHGLEGRSLSPAPLTSCFRTCLPPDSVAENCEHLHFDGG